MSADTRDKKHMRTYVYVAQSAGVVEYSDCNSTDRFTPTKRVSWVWYETASDGDAPFLELVPSWCNG